MIPVEIHVNLYIFVFINLSKLNCFQFLIDYYFIVDDVRQFALVTHIDKVGVPKDDMVNALQYSCVYDICQKVSEVFQLPQSHVIPVSNYFDSEDPGDAKNAMALKAFWRIFKSGRDYIRENWGDENLSEGQDSSE